MDNREEVKLTQEEINATPKAVLEHLFALSEDRRIAYEESEIVYIRKINKIKNEILPTLFKELKSETEQKFIKCKKKCIKHNLNLIKNCKKELRLIYQNEDTLWENALTMDKVLGYGLDE